MSNGNNEREGVMHHTKDYFCQIPQNKFGSLQDALEEIFKIKPENPKTRVCLYGSNGKGESMVSMALACSNIPYMHIYLPDGDMTERFLPLDPKEMLEWMNDKPKFISELKEEIEAAWGVFEIGSWEVDESIDKEFYEVILFVNPSSGKKAEAVMEDFNREITALGYFSLYFDSESSTIQGQFQPKEVKGLFNRNKIKRENEWYDERFNAFLSAIKPYLRRF